MDPFILKGLAYMDIHSNILRHLLNPPPKGQVGGSNPLRDANEINILYESFEYNMA